MGVESERPREGGWRSGRGGRGGVGGRRGRGVGGVCRNTVVVATPCRETVYVAILCCGNSSFWLKGSMTKRKLVPSDIFCSLTFSHGLASTLFKQVTPVHGASAGRYFELTEEHDISYPSYYPTEFEGKETKIATINELYVLVRIGTGKSYVNPITFFSKGMHKDLFGRRVNVQLRLHEGVYLRNAFGDDRRKMAKMCLDKQVSDAIKANKDKEETNRMVQGYKNEMVGCLSDVTFSALSPRPAETNTIDYVQWCVRNGQEVMKDESKAAYIAWKSNKIDDEVLSVDYTVAPSGNTWDYPDETELTRTELVSSSDDLDEQRDIFETEIERLPCGTTTTTDDPVLEPDSESVQRGEDGDH